MRTPERASLPEGVDVGTGDLSAPAGLTAALTDVRQAFLLGAFATPELLEALRSAGVEHVVLLTSRCVVGGRPDNAITRMWLDAEAVVRDSGIPSTVLRPSSFDSNALRWLPQLRRGDVVRAPWPQVPIAAIDPADIAAVAAAALTESGPEHTAITLSGPQPLTPGDQVATLAAVLDRPLRYEPLSDAEARAELIADTPEPFIDAFFRFYSDGEFDDSRDRRHRPAVDRPTAAYLRAVGRSPRVGVFVAVGPTTRCGGRRSPGR